MKFTDDLNKPCDEMRYLPYSKDGNILVCHSSYLREITWRKEQIKAGRPYDLPTWESLKIYKSE